MASEVDIAWAAGLFEGEGAIMIARTAGSERRISYYLQVVVAMTDDEPVCRLADLWGGSLHRQHRVKRWRPSLRWVLSGRASATFLQDIRPFVRSDRLNAKIAVALSFQDQKKRFGRGNPASSEYHATQHAYWERMKLLNLKGSDTLNESQRIAVVLEGLPA